MNQTLEAVEAAFPVVKTLGRNDRGVIPLVFQTTATDCGAACLAMVLAHHGHHVSLEELRGAMAVGRDGVTARAIIETAALYGLNGRGVTVPSSDLGNVPRGSILFLDFAHFVVLDDVDAAGVSLVDPGCGRRRLTPAEFAKSFTGVALVFEKALHFKKTDKLANPVFRHLRLALAGSKELGRIALVSVLLQLLSVLFPLMQGRLADRVLPRNDVHLLAILLASVAVTVVFYLLASVVRSQLLLYLRTRFDAKLTLGFVDHLLRLPYEFFERRQVGDLQMRVSSVATVREALTGAVLSGLIDGVLVISHLVFLVFMSVKMTLVASGLVALQALVFLVSRRRMMDLAGGSIAKQSEAANALNELLVGVETLKASGSEQAASQSWAAKYVDVMNINLRRGGVSSLSEALLGALNVVGPMALLVAGALDVLDHRIGLGTMLSANAMAVGFIHPAMSLVSTLQNLVMVRVHLQRIDDVLVTPPEQSGSNKVSLTLQGEIMLDRVSFRYNPRSPAVVNGVSLHIRAGECVAIVGKSGSGKTTLGRLLLGLYAPTSGAVRFDGVSAEQIDLRALRRQLGVVVQRPHIFGSTVRANIALADPTIPLERVRAAAKCACIHEDIERMPMQYDTAIVAGGASLSGGQRQRLALARSLVHHPAVLLLDEATSALDAVSERAVQANLDRLPCTRILIAHRLSTVMRADRILVMHEGQIVEQGSHEELLGRGGAYARLVAAQLGTEEAKEPGWAPKNRRGVVLPLVSRARRTDQNRLVPAEAERAGRRPAPFGVVGAEPQPASDARLPILHLEEDLQVDPTLVSQDDLTRIMTSPPDLAANGGR